MKKILRFIPAFVLAAALLTVTALACSPSVPLVEQHENVIQIDKEKPACLVGGYCTLQYKASGGTRPFPTDDALPCAFGPWRIVPGKELTCTKGCEKQAFCSICKKWYITPAPPADHFWIIDARVFATCTTPGYTRFICDDCGKEGDTITMPALGHSFGEWFTTTQPTCMEEGIQKRECTRCGMTETRAISKTGHTFCAWFTTTQPTCTEEGIQARECTQCGVTERRGISKADHSWDAGTVVVQPTAKREGVMEWRCNVCGMTRTRPIPMLTQGASNTPDSAPTADTPPDTAADTDGKDETNSEPRKERNNKDGKSDNKNEPSSDTSEINSFDKDTVDQDALQKHEKGSTPEGAAVRSFSVVKILMLILVPVLLITAGIILLLVRRKKTRQP